MYQGSKTAQKLRLALSLARMTSTMFNAPDSKNEEGQPVVTVLKEDIERLLCHTSKTIKDIR